MEKIPDYIEEENTVDEMWDEPELPAKPAGKERDKVSGLFLLQLICAAALTLAILIVGKGLIGEKPQDLPVTGGEDPVIQAAEEYTKDSELLEKIRSLFESKEPSEAEADPTGQQDEPEGKGGMYVGADGSSVSAMSLSASRLKLSGSLAVPADVTLAPVITTAKAVTPLGEAKITSEFGYRYHPITGDVDFHTGIDFAAPQGTAIQVVFPGTVLEVGYSKVFGNYIIVEHTLGMQTRYAHCSEILVEEGIKVRQGETIARVGSTGLSTGSHLHFDVIIDGYYANPAWLYADAISLT